jgi:PAS domain S-box-containing protein
MKTIAQIKAEAHAAVVVADYRGIITEVNDRFTAELGWQRDEIVGMRLETIIPTRLRDTHRLGFSRFLRTQRPTILGQPLDLKALTRDGREIDATHLIVAEHVNGNWMFAASIHRRGKS